MAYKCTPLLYSINPSALFGFFVILFPVYVKKAVKYFANKKFVSIFAPHFVQYRII